MVNLIGYCIIEDLLSSKYCYDNNIRTYEDIDETIAALSDEDIDETIPDLLEEDWNDVVYDIPYADLLIPRLFVMEKLGIDPDTYFNDIDEDDLDDEEFLCEDDIDGGYSFITLRLFINKDYCIHHIQYIGHQHDGGGSGYDELLNELPTDSHYEVMLTMIDEILAQKLIILPM